MSTSIALSNMIRVVSHLETGRVDQKQRTRDALVAKAMELLRAGKVFSVAEVADLARVGRTTAYRYFPTQASLLAQAVLTAVGHMDEGHFDGFFKTCSDPALRVEAVVKTADASVRAHESEYRTMLRLSFESEARDVPHRSRFRVKWLEKALADVRRQLGKKSYERVVAALGLCVGIEPSVVLGDIYQLSAENAREVKLWAAKALLRQALEEAAMNNERQKKRNPNARR